MRPLATTKSDVTMSATSAEEGEKSCGSAPTGMSVIAVAFGLAQATMSPTTLPSMVVVDTTETVELLDAPSLASSVDPSSVEEGSASSSTDEVSSSVALCEAAASEDVESSELEHAARDPAEAKAAAVIRATLCDAMGASCP
jgi:hypothetical protein